LVCAVGVHLPARVVALNVKLLLVEPPDHLDVVRCLGELYCAGDVGIAGEDSAGWRARSFGGSLWLARHHGLTSGEGAGGDDARAAALLCAPRHHRALDVTHDRTGLARGPQAEVCTYTERKTRDIVSPRRGGARRHSFPVFLFFCLLAPAGRRAGAPHACGTAGSARARGSGRRCAPQNKRPRELTRQVNDGSRLAHRVRSFGRGVATVVWTTTI